MRQAADERARELNRELEQADVSNRFYYAKQVQPSVWDAVEHRRSGLWRWIVENSPFSNFAP
jgi:hypothetical protein